MPGLATIWLQFRAAGFFATLTGPDGRVWDEGKVLAFEPPRRLSVSWLHVSDEALKAERRAAP